MTQTFILFMVSLMAVFGGCGKRDFSRLKPKVSQTLIPWLGASGQFGFADSSGRMVIQPQYDDAGLFCNGFAVVKKEGKYGVINTRNDLVFPFKYAVAKLFLKRKNPS